MDVTGGGRRGLGAQAAYRVTHILGWTTQKPGWTTSTRAQPSPRVRGA